MANYEQSIRSNTFLVHDVEKLHADLALYGIPTGRDFSRAEPDDGEIYIVETHLTPELEAIAKALVYGAAQHVEPKAVQVFMTFPPQFDHEIVYERLMDAEDPRVMELDLDYDTVAKMDPYDFFAAIGMDEPFFDIVNALSHHMVPGVVGVLMSIGREKWASFSGTATYFSADRDTPNKTIRLDDIYTKAEETFGKSAVITGCEG